MPRRPRIVLADVPLHIIQRGNNRGKCFRCDSDFLVYLDLLYEATKRAGCDVHAYVLMGNHVHLLATPRVVEAAAQMMKAVGERYVRYFNKRYRRTGTLFDCRFRSSVVHDETYLMVCYRYIELNPVRARITADPALYRWSSYRANAFGAHDAVVTPHPLFIALGCGSEERQKIYRGLFDEALDSGEINNLRDATNHNYVCGTTEFQTHVANSLGVAVERTRRP
jgi:putative transposase